MELHLKSVLLLTVISLSFSEVRVNLTAVVGSSITFPDPVKERGFFSFASVYNEVFEIEEDIYTNRLHWNSSTGRFTLSDLLKSDSGVYTIDSKKGNVFYKYYELKVYEPLSLPLVSRMNMSADSCTLQCSVNLTEQTTLSWFRGEQRVDSSSSSVLPLTVQLWENTSEHKCVAQNPAVCTHKTQSTGRSYRECWVLLIHLTVFGLGLAIFTAVLHMRAERKRRSTETSEPN
ncbi:uncharacterized protein LOC129410377 [Boleophthalmus pectinirostris]|uniref:uncharacterized protein LOC129410377 n=1 Tax=Boleophthalmus pectinirostris TaxID=150288 RepID=UPI00242CF19A|nr:uncharacterized protein LOC129410377 [Boleophthalmus pectinirostris]